MGISISHFELMPLGSLNALHKNKQSRLGLYLCLDEKYYTEYTPWHQFGDASVEDLIQLIKENKTPRFLMNLFELDSKKDQISHREFKNHGFNCESEFVSKYKVTSLSHALKTIETSQTPKLRLDFNNCLESTQAMTFWSELSQKERFRLDYLEDITECESTVLRLLELGAPLARDRNSSHQAKYPISIFKPNIDEVISEAPKAIYSSYMTSSLGIYQSYLSLMQGGDLEEYHGIVTPNLYENEFNLFEQKGHFHKINDKSITLLYEMIKGLEWKQLV